MQNTPKIKDINEVKLGITLIQEILAAFSLDELKNLTKDGFLSELDVINAYEEEWKVRRCAMLRMLRILLGEN